MEPALPRLDRNSRRKSALADGEGSARKACQRWNSEYVHSCNCAKEIWRSVNLLNFRIQTKNYNYEGTSALHWRERKQNPLLFAEPLDFFLSILHSRKKYEVF